MDVHIAKVCYAYFYYR